MASPPRGHAGPAGGTLVSVPSGSAMGRMAEIRSGLDLKLRPVRWTGLWEEANC